MKDQYGRNIDYIRVSVTDRCNLRCQYCMPAEGIEMASHDSILRYDEIIRICKILAELGVKKIKITGGEPLVRKDIIELIADIKKITGIEQVTITTNAINLKKQMKHLVEVGIDGINISLDTLNRSLFKEITRRDELPRVLEGIEEALKYDQVPIKINCVPLGRKEQNIEDIAAFAKDHPIHVRFIEMMPIGMGKDYHFLSEEEILKQLSKTYGTFTPYEGTLGNGPSHYYQVEDFQGKIGFISAMSHKFCHNCNRVRLTSGGFLKTCLQFETGSDLKQLLRGGASDEEIKEAIINTIHNKPKGHEFLSGKIERENNLSMYQIGG
ncbi:MAG TPA: GTP 3',8-cyclase MoaA [Candidatus Merdenecus merdavium]|nr:GTP 3',8-cyclase MoaA [Candidatus Merdenecus merdavium]